MKAVKKSTKAEKQAKLKGTILKKNLPKSPVKDFYLNSTTIPVKIVADDPMFIPQYATEGAANCDLVANVPVDGNGNRQVSVTHRGVILVDCGFSMEIKPGYKAVIMARSGWASKGVVVTNAPGQIDEDYRGRIKVIVGNFGTNNPVTIKHGDRIAQMAIVPVWKFDWQVVTELSETVRGEGGFGSTG